VGAVVNTLLLTARLLLFAIFFLAGVTKLVDRDGSRAAVAGFGVSDRLANPLGLIVPVVELVTALALLVSVTAWAGSVMALALLALFTAAIARSLARGEAPDCHCFGQLHSAPVNGRLVCRNVALAALAGLLVARGSSAVGTSATAWWTRLDAVAQVAIGAGSGLTLLLMATLWFAFRLLRRHGVTLARAEALEQQLREAGLAPRLLDEGIDLLDAEPAGGLPVGAWAPAFSLPDLAGQLVTLQELLLAGRPLLLVFTLPGCNPCLELLPRLVAWSAQHAERVTIVLIGEGGSEAIAREVNGSDSLLVLAQEGREVSELFDISGTPSAVAITPDGRIARQAAKGAPGIEAALSELLAPAAPVIAPLSAPVHGPRVGDDAPELLLPELGGGMLTSASLRGREHVLVFWNPGCGFCQQMEAGLRERASRVVSEPQLVLISRGTEADHADLLPVARIAIDEDFVIAGRFGANGTPMAIAVDADGRIASPLRVGGDAVLQLLTPPDTGRDTELVVSQVAARV
jgi:thiol-disulfide isomerase/thioredoxin/uncharacterized membrane protein YphA (DoxX/SURF4 family)